MSTLRHLAILVFAGIAACGSPQRAAPGYVDQPDRQPAPPTSSFDGEVIGVDRAAPGDSLAANVRLVLRPRNSDPVTIELAPGWYLDEQGLAFSTSQRLRGRGSRSTAADGGQTIVAWEIEDKERAIPLRDEHGRPMWQRPADAGR